LKRSYKNGYCILVIRVAFTPKGGCPLKQGPQDTLRLFIHFVAFTPKGGCPLKQKSILDP